MSKAKRKEQPWTDSDKARAIALRDNGMSHRQIATAMRRSRSSVCGIFKRMTDRGLTPPARDLYTTQFQGVTLAKYALGEKARQRINAMWEELSA